MLLIAGSMIVSDSGSAQDIDIVYLTADIGRYVLFLSKRRLIEERLTLKVRRKVSFSPYLVIAPTIIGNLFLGINMLRLYSIRRGISDSPLIKILLGRLDKRWLVVHLAYAVLGLLSSSSLREQRKYCAMIAEGLFYAKRAAIPASWDRTITLGSMLSASLGLRNLHRFFESCRKLVSGASYRFDIDYIEEAIEEYLGKVVRIGDSDSSTRSLSDALRVLHEKIIKAILGEKTLAWRKCSTLIISLIIARHNRVKMLRSRRLRRLAIRLYKICRNQIPVLSPLVHP